VSYQRLQFECPVCGQKLQAKQGRFKCNHKGTAHDKKFYHDPDKFELDEVHVKIIVLTTKEGE